MLKLIWDDGGFDDKKEAEIPDRDTWG